MAAEHCFDGSDECVRETINVLAPFSYWRNVFLFIAGRIFFEKENLTDSLVAVCDRLNEPFTDRAHGFIVTGSRLAFAILKDGAARNQPENSRVLARRAAQLLENQALQGVPDFSSLFDTEAANVLKESLTTQITLDQVVFNQAAWSVCLELVKANQQFAVALLTDYFPWGHPQALPFISNAVDDGKSQSDVFWALFKAHILDQVPPVRLLNSHEELNHHLVATPIAILRSIYLQRFEDPRVSVVDGTGQDCAVSLKPCGTDILNSWAKLELNDADIASKHPIWLLFHAISNFARSPNQETLTKQVSVIYDTCNESWTDRFAYPWQFSLVMDAKQADIDQSTVCNAITSGALGRREDWLRWGNVTKIKVAQLSQVSLLSVSDRHLGAVFKYSGAQIARDRRRSLRQASALTAAVLQWDGIAHIDEHFVNLTCYGLGEENLLPWSLDDQSIVEQFLNCLSAHHIPVSRSVVAAIVRSSFSIEKKVELLADIEVNVTLFAFLRDWSRIAASVNTGIEEIVSKAKGSPKFVKVISALSFLPPTQAIRLIAIDSIAQRDYADSAHRDSVDVLRINSFNWSQSDVEPLGKAFTGISCRRPAFLSEFVQFIDLEGIEGPNIEALLLAVLGNSESQLKYWQRDQLANLLVKLVERRAAVKALPDPLTIK